MIHIHTFLAVVLRHKKLFEDSMENCDIDWISHHIFCLISSRFAWRMIMWNPSVCLLLSNAYHTLLHLLSVIVYCPRVLSLVNKHQKSLHYERYKWYAGHTVLCETLLAIKRSINHITSIARVKFADEVDKGYLSVVDKRWGLRFLGLSSCLHSIFLLISSVINHVGREVFYHLILPPFRLGYPMYFKESNPETPEELLPLPLVGFTPKRHFFDLAGQCTPKPYFMVYYIKTYSYWKISRSTALALLHPSSGLPCRLGAALGYNGHQRFFRKIMMLNWNLE